jgi:transcriptional regulator with XRE-family HTH domain
MDQQLSLVRVSPRGTPRRREDRFAIFRLGRAIAEQRRRRGLSQPELARLLDQPPSWVSQVERGLLPVDPMCLLGDVAGALGTPLPLPRNGCGRLTAASPAIVRLLQDLASGECRRRVRPAGCAAPAAASLPALRAQADQALALARARAWHYGELAGLLSDLLPQLQDALRAAPGQQDLLALQELLGHQLSGLRGGPGQAGRAAERQGRGQPRTDRRAAGRRPGAGGCECVLADPGPAAGRPLRPGR